MLMRKLRMICHLGDKTLKEWDPKTVSPEALKEIEEEYQRKVAEGYFAVDITDKRDKFMTAFDPDAEILLIPRVVGG
jgi:hypothetical protein